MPLTPYVPPDDPHPTRSRLCNSISFVEYEESNRLGRCALPVTCGGVVLFGNLNSIFVKVDLLQSPSPVAWARRLRVMRHTRTTVMLKVFEKRTCQGESQDTYPSAALHEISLFSDLRKMKCLKRLQSHRVFQTRRSSQHHDHHH